MTEGLPTLNISGEWGQSTVEVGDVLTGRIGPITEIPEDVTELKVLAPKSEGESEKSSIIVTSSWDPKEKVLKILLTPTRDGDFKMDPLVIGDQNGKPFAQTNLISLQVKPIPQAKDGQQKEEIAPPVPPMGVAVPLGEIAARATSALFILAVLGYIAWRIYKRWRSKAKKETGSKQVEIPVPPHVIAYRELESLEEKKWVEKSQFKLHYFGVSEIIKKYLGARHRIQAEESTTRELMAELRLKTTLAPHELSEIESFFNDLDPVKFTDWVPPLEKAKDVIRRARGIVMMHERGA